MLLKFCQSDENINRLNKTDLRDLVRLCETWSRVSETLRVTAYRKGSVLSFSVMFWKREGRAFNSCGRSLILCRMFSVTLPDIWESSPTLGSTGSSLNRLNLVATLSKTSTSDS